MCCKDFGRAWSRMITKPNPSICRNCNKVPDCDCLCHTTDLFDNPHDKIYGQIGFNKEIAGMIQLGQDRRWGNGKTEKDWIEN